MHNFTPGQRVICVDASIKGEFAHDAISNFKSWPVEGNSYTVRENRDNAAISNGIVLEELANPIVFMPLLGIEQEGAFASWRFVLDPVQPEPVEAPQAAPPAPVIIIFFPTYGAAGIA